MDVNFEPLHDRVFVKRDPLKTQTESGIIMQRHDNQQPSLGTVVACGEGRYDLYRGLIPISVKPGDRVLFGYYSGQVVKLNGEDYLSLREDDIFAVVEE